MENKCKNCYYSLKERSDNCWFNYLCEITDEIVEPDFSCEYFTTIDNDYGFLCVETEKKED